MAERKKKTASLGCLFWIAIILLFIVLFFLKRDTIAKNLGNTGALDLLFGSKTTLVSGEGDKGAEKTPVTDVLPPAATPDATPGTAPSGAVKPAAKTAEGATSGDGSAAEEPTASKQDPAGPPKEAPLPKTTGSTDANNNAVTAKPATTTKAAEPAKAQPAPTRKATLFFVQIDPDGDVVRKEISREVPKTDSPMTEALKALFSGPSSAETAKGMRSLIPEGSKILSATVKDGVAVLNLSGEFQFNQFGIEGYIGQLAQVVFTATAFPTVNSVQFLIDGQRREYLGAEGVWIGTPLSRDKF